MPAHSPLLKTPLHAAFFCSLLLVAGCPTEPGPKELPAAACSAETTAIATVQGDGFRSDMIGQPVTVRGVATWVKADKGFYLEELASDADPRTSNALFVEHDGLAATLSKGDRVVVAGKVAELGQGPDTLTALVDIDAMRQCERGVPLPSSESRLPLDSAEREALEGMRASFRQALLVSNVYQMSDGLIRVSPNRILPSPTEVARPGRDARTQAARNRRARLDIRLADADRQQYSVRATVMAAAGVMGHDRERQLLLAEDALPLMPVAQYRNDPPAADELRIASLNLHNYFNGDGRGGGFPAGRGARTPADFERQRSRLAAAIDYIQPHVLGVMELENDGFGPRSANQDFLQDLHEATGQDWAAVNPLDGPIGSDQITVGLFYRPDLLRPLGTGWVLASAPFQRENRQPLAQAFRHLASGASLLVVINHLKSKGSCPANGPNADQQDGQSCWNLSRTKAARQVVRWVERLAGDLTDGRALILGDMNAYRLEDPIEIFLEAGFKDLTASAGLRLEYTFVYYGEAGTLDHAFASPALEPWVRSARILNINAGQPPGVELQLPWLRSSDHDPVVIDLRPVRSGTKP